MPNDPRNDGGLSRRSALKVGAAGCTTAIVATSLGSTSLPHNRVSLSKWQAAIGHDVRIVKRLHSNEGSFRPVTLRLVDAVQQEMKTQHGHDLPEGVPAHSISVYFEGNMRTEIESAVYRAVHPELGERDLFINEIQASPGATVRTFESILG